MNRAAVLQYKHARASQPLEIDALLKRLTSVAETQDDSQKRTFSRPPAETPPAETFESTEATPPPITAAEAEASNYRELIESGGRPVCSIEDLANLVAKPTTPVESYETLLPWLTEHPDSRDKRGELKTVFSRQFKRWWDFRKSQWDNRGKGDDDQGFSAFLEACRRL